MFSLSGKLSRSDAVSVLLVCQWFLFADDLWPVLAHSSLPVQFFGISFLILLLTLKLTVF